MPPLAFPFSFLASRHPPPPESASPLDSAGPLSLSPLVHATIRQPPLPPCYFTPPYASLLPLPATSRHHMPAPSLSSLLHTTTRRPSLPPCYFTPPYTSLLPLPATSCCHMPAPSLSPLLHATTHQPPPSPYWFSPPRQSPPPLPWISSPPPHLPLWDHAAGFPLLEPTGSLSLFLDRAGPLLGSRLHMPPACSLGSRCHTPPASLGSRHYRSPSHLETCHHHHHRIPSLSWNSSPPTTGQCLDPAISRCHRPYLWIRCHHHRPLLPGSHRHLTDSHVFQDRP